uniref:Uncharacterized protein n=1 Tax=Setaria italica TaxID=4555 RepID=K4ANK3_SETIT
MVILGINKICSVRNNFQCCKKPSALIGSHTVQLFML